MESAGSDVWFRPCVLAYGAVLRKIPFRIGEVSLHIPVYFYIMMLGAGGILHPVVSPK